MEKALRLQEQMALERFEKMNSLEQHRVLRKIDILAKDRGFDNQNVLKDQKPYIWNQLCAQAVDKI